MTTDQLSALLAQDPAAVLEHDRRLYEQQIVRAADLIAAHAQERPAVLLAGPSGSGKTTTALLIERELDRRGMETHTLSMDDYFCPLTERELELFSRNELDLERPSRVDVPFFQEQLGKLLAGEEVELPRYDFKNSVRVFDGRTLRRRPGELVILEGIFSGLGDTKAPFFFSLFSMWGVRVTSTWLCVTVLHLGLGAVWACMAIDNMTRFALMMTRFLRGKWKTRLGLTASS